MSPDGQHTRIKFRFGKFAPVWVNNDWQLWVLFIKKRSKSHETLSLNRFGKKKLK